jgi:hypothetical protein
MELGKSITQRSRRSQRGLGLVGETRLVDIAADGRELHGIREKHRTEVTEAIEGIGGFELSLIL